MLDRPYIIDLGKGNILVREIVRILVILGKHLYRFFARSTVSERFHNLLVALAFFVQFPTGCYAYFPRATAFACHLRDTAVSVRVAHDVPPFKKSRPPFAESALFFLGNEFDICQYRLNGFICQRDASQYFVQFGE